jgi:hypothetical protein
MAASAAWQNGMAARPMDILVFLVMAILPDRRIIARFWPRAYA